MQLNFKIPWLTCPVATEKKLWLNLIVLNYEVDKKDSPIISYF